ncbi:MAG: ribosome maturation factor RimM [Bacteroidota bacterium]
MKKEECFLFGKIIKTHGYKGELIISVSDVIPDISDKTEFVFVEIEGLLVPFFFESCMGSGNTLNIKFEDVDNEESSRRLCGCNLWLPDIFLSEKSKNHLELPDLSGYKVIDKVKGETGTLIKIIEMPQQQLLQINFQNKEILIPVAEEIITRVDKKNKIIFINVPEGLIDLYLKT